MTLEIRTGELEVASCILLATAEQLQVRGQALWPLASLTPERLLRYYPQDTWRVGYLDGQAVGTYNLLEADRWFWPDDPPGQARYLHKLGVHPAWQGRGLAHRLLSEAEAECRVLGLEYLKLDTALDRPQLQHLYESYGFARAGEAQYKATRVIRYLLPLR